MQNYEKIRVYDGHNCDTSFQLTYICRKKKIIKKPKFSKNIIIDNYLIKKNCEQYYNERIKNYRQMVSDFTDLQSIRCCKTYFYPPILIKRNDDYNICDVKIDELDTYRFVKFQLKTLSNDMCFYDYYGDLETYIKNEISTDNGYSFYINNKLQKFKNLYDAFKYYLKKLKVEGQCYSPDNIVILTDNITKASNKYLKRSTLGKNLFIRDLKNESFPNLYGIFLAQDGNFLYVIKHCNNPCEEYNKILSVLENSYDLLKQYILLNKYLLSKYNNYCTYTLKTRRLKEDYKVICFYNNFREKLLNKSMGTVGFIIKEFERECYNVDFSKKSKIIKKYIIKEFRERKLDINELISDTTSKTVAEIYDKTLNRFN